MLHFGLSPQPDFNPRDTIFGILSSNYDRSMKTVLSENDKDLLEKKVARAEEQTRSQIALATVIHSDNYAEIP